MKLKTLHMAVLVPLLLTTSPLWAAAPPLEAPYTSSSPSTGSQKPIERPVEIDEDTGDYYYRPKSDDGIVHYKVDGLPPIKGGMFIRFGTIGPFAIKSDNSTSTYKDIYSKSSSFVVFLEYDRKIGQFGGQWSYKLGSGVTTEQGGGRFSDPNTLTNTNSAPPKEKFNFYVMPNTALLNFKMRYSDSQLLTPYLEAGAGYFTFIEYRSDGKHTSFGGAPVLAGAAGLLISMDIFDKNSSSLLYQDYDINHIWLDLQFRYNLGLVDKKDFSSNMMTAGFGFAF
jgi:hypothetical protein